MTGMDEPPAPSAAPWQVWPASLCGPRLQPLFDAAVTRRLEAAALADHAAHALMQRAGLAVARLALALSPSDRRVDVFAGPGNNGGDGLVAATHLHQSGLAVRVLFAGDPARLPADAAVAYAAAHAAGVPMVNRLDAAHGRRLVVDALLGLGAARPPQGRLADLIDTINTRAAQGAQVLAVDLPSGLHPDTGQPLGAQAVHATDTLALLTLKPGLFTGAGRDHAGSVWCSDLGVLTADQVVSAWLQRAGEPQSTRSHASHKGRFGDVALVGGAPGMGGALLLAARAALAAGAGRVYWSALDPSLAALDALQPELMYRPLGWINAPAQLAALTVVCGCGGADAVRAALPPLLAHAARLVLDADALNAVAAEPGLQQALRARAARAKPTVLTPHPLEAARLLGTDTAAVQADRLAAAQELAEKLQSTVLLKGSGSVIAAPDATPIINASGNALLASAGTGDVLAGWIGGLWAQQPQRAAQDVAAAAAWRHGVAADRALVAPDPPPSLTASALIEAMRRAGQRAKPPSTRR